MELIQQGLRMEPLSRQNIFAAHYTYPGEEMFFVYVWVKGYPVAESFNIKRKEALEIYPNLPIVQAVHNFAKDKFFINHTLDNGRFPI